MSPFDDPGEWLRCAFHAHTTNSDGELSPELLVRHYEWAGYDVLATTDHWVRTDVPSTEKLLVTPSCLSSTSRRCRKSSRGSQVAAASRTSRTPTGAGSGPSSGRRARGSSGS